MNSKGINSNEGNCGDRSYQVPQFLPRLKHLDWDYELRGFNGELALIVFQTEIRRGLEHIGVVRTFPLVESANEAEVMGISN